MVGKIGNQTWAIAHVIWPVTEVVIVVTASIRDPTAECILIEIWLLWGEWEWDNWN